MLKKISSGTVGLLLLMTPVFASADAITDMQSQIQQLLAQIAALQSNPSSTLPPQNPDSDTPTVPRSSSECPILSVQLQRGSRDVTTGGQVTNLQIWLADYYNLDEETVVSGYFGRVTEGHVIRFQQSQGLPAFGLVGPATRTRIAQVCGGTVSPPLPGASMTASPASGAAPLTVNFSGNAGSAGYTLEYGDGSQISAGCGHGGCSPGQLPLAVFQNHTYTTPGTYVAKLRRHFTSNAANCAGADCNVVATAPITVTGVSNTAANLTYRFKDKTFRSVNNVTRDFAQKICNVLPFPHESCLHGNTTLIPQGIKEDVQRITILSPGVNEYVQRSSQNSFIFNDPLANEYGDYRIFYALYPNDSAAGDVYEVPFSQTGRTGSTVRGTVDLSQLPNGNYYPGIINVTQGISGSVGAYVFLTGSTPTPTNTITVTAPNGGERWEVGQMGTITWRPYGYNPDVNPANQVTAYLEKYLGEKENGEKVFEPVGKIVPSGKASIHWEGQILNQMNQTVYPQPGTGYVIRVVNNVTGATDRSDAPFEITPRAIDIQVNGSEGPISLLSTQNITVTLKIASAVDTCLAYGIDYPGAPNVPSSVISVGTLPGKYTSGHISVNCRKTGTSIYVGDSVHVNSIAPPPFVDLKITSPNGGEQITINQPYTINWQMQGISTPVSIALYKNDQWLAWIAPSLGLDKSLDNKYSYTWTQSDNLSSPLVGGNIYKIYITGPQAGGSGYAEDKSDAPFTFISAPTPPPLPPTPPTPPPPPPVLPGPVPVLTMSATPASVSVGSGTTVYWTAQYTTSCSFYINGVFASTLTSAQATQSAFATGPLTTHTNYTMKCIGTNTGTYSQSVTVTVIGGNGASASNESQLASAYAALAAALTKMVELLR